MSLTHLFQQLSQAFHHDASSSLVDDLAIDFTTQVAHTLYEHKVSTISLCLIKPESLRQFEGIHLLLAHYGLCLTKRLRQQQDAYVIGVRLTSRYPHADELTGRVRIKRTALAHHFKQTTLQLNETEEAA